jgi:hypothetical protein
MAKEIICAFGTDIDSVAGWIGSYGGGDSPSDIQRGIFASEVGVPRLLRLFNKARLALSLSTAHAREHCYPSRDTASPRVNRSG